MEEKSLPRVNSIDEPFWQAAERSRLVIQKCRRCRKLQFFPRAVCAGCFSSDLDWIESSGWGKVHSFSWVWVPRNPAFKDEVPICYADVVLDEGVLMQSRILAGAGKKVEVGLRVKVAFQETGHPNIKLPVFELVE